MNGDAVTLSADFEGVYASAPVSLWIEDYGGIRNIFDRLRAEGVSDLAAHLAGHPELVDAAMREIKVLDVNAYTLQLYRAASKEQFLSATCSAATCACISPRSSPRCGAATCPTKPKASTT